MSDLEMVWDFKGYTQCTRFFPCECGSEGLVLMNVDSWHDQCYGAPCIDIAFLTHASKYADTKMTWGSRFRYAWQCLRGRPFADMVSLTRDVALQFAGSIIEAVERVEDMESQEG